MYLSGLGLYSFSGRVCGFITKTQVEGVVLAQMRMASLRRGNISHNLDGHCLEDTRPCGALPTLVGGYHYYGFYDPW